ncbi:MAG: hypothetical protein ACI38A_03295, partial [Candidatus Ornithomonoglobus sp.]
EKALHDEASYIADAREEGRAEGRAEGEAKGRAEGIADILARLKALGADEELLKKAEEQI